MEATPDSIQAVDITIYNCTPQTPVTPCGPRQPGTPAGSWAAPCGPSWSPCRSWAAASRGTRAA